MRGIHEYQSKRGAFTRVDETTITRQKKKSGADSLLFKFPNGGAESELSRFEWDDSNSGLNKRV